MMRKVLTVFFVLCLGAGYTQESTISPNSDIEYNIKYKTDNSNIELKTLVLVPFEPKLYSSEIDRELAKNAKLDFNQIRNKMRVGLNNIIYVEANKDIPTINFITEDPIRQRDLSYIYKSIGYQYREMPPKDDKQPEETKLKKGWNKIKSQFEPKKKQEKSGTSIKNGQLYSVHSNKERYMSTKVFNPAMLRTIKNEYAGKYFLFINQLDIHIVSSDYRALQVENYLRQIKVHYSVLDHEGKLVYGGAEKAYFSSKNNNIDRIIRGQFSKIAKQILAKVPGLKPREIVTKEVNSSTGTKAHVHTTN